MVDFPPEVYELPLFAKLNPKQKKLLESEARFEAHPAETVLDRLSRRGIVVRRTDREEAR